MMKAGFLHDAPENASAEADPTVRPFVHRGCGRRPRADCSCRKFLMIAEGGSPGLGRRKNRGFRPRLS